MEDIPEGAVVSTEPLVCGEWTSLAAATYGRQDTTLWLHIGIQILAFGLIFPTGMVLGVRQSPTL
jgi:hypothetical protein